MANGPYKIDALHARVRGVYTHTVPVDAYRGAGRPEAAYVLERLVDRCARELGLSQETIRLRNFVPPEAMPYNTQTKRTYDVGDFGAALQRCVEKADAAGFEGRANQSKSRGLIRGLGLASYVECTAMGAGEETSLLLEKDGTLTLLIGTQSTGQGHETAYAQIVAEQFDVPLDRIKVVQGDSDRIASGGGTGGSRSIPIGAVTTARASSMLAESLKDLAADKLEAASVDLEIVDGRFRIVGTDRSLSLKEIAALPAATPERLQGAGSYTPEMATYPNGTHICEVEIDPQDRDGPHRALYRRRRFRLHPEPPPAGRPDSRRDRPGGWPGADGARPSTTATASCFRQASWTIACRVRTISPPSSSRPATCRRRPIRWD